MSLDAARIQLPERYRVVRHVANGGMASVWSAEDSILGRLVAVKVLAAHVAADVTARARFEREARTAAKVSDHPNVVTIYDVGEHQGTPFIVMELLTGGTVADRLRTSGDRPPARSVTAQWLQQAAGALDHAHAEGIVHRDVKPANLLLDERDRLAVGDFGIARAADDVGLTQAGQVLGTAAYLSPEQALGKGATAASDRYALAVVAYELLTGRRPFRAEHVAGQARQHVEDEVPPTGLGAEIDAVLARAMAKDPDERYFTASRFVEELGAVSKRGSAPLEAPTDVTRAVPRAVTATQPPAAPPPRRREPTPAASAPVPPPPPPRSDQGSGGSPRKALLVLAAALVGAAAAFAIFSMVGGGGDDDPAGTRTEQRAQTQASEPKQDEPATTQEQPAATTETPPPAAETPAPAADGEPPDNEPEEGPGPATESNESPSALDARGFQMIQQGKAAEAVPVLEQAVAGFEAQGDAADPTGYGYALFNLGTAYAAAGRPAEAIPLFERRLQLRPGDRPGIVKKALKDARKAAGQA